MSALMRKLREMTALQESLSAKRTAAMVGQTKKALLETVVGDFIEARLPDNVIVRVEGDASAIGRHAMVRITEAKSWILLGEIEQIL